MPTDETAENSASLTQFSGALAVFRVLSDGSVAYETVNDGHRQLFRLDQRELSGHSVDEVLPEKLREIVASHARECEQLRCPLEFEWCDEFDGNERWIRNLLFPATTSSGHQVLLTSIDVTQTVQGERARRIHEERLRAVVDHAHDAILTIDETHRVRFMNAAAEVMFGYKSEEVVGNSLSMLLPERFRKKHGSYADSFSAGAVRSRDMRERTEVCGLRKNGQEFRAQVAISKISLDGRTEMAAIIRDVSITAQMISELTTRATIDFLTGLFNRQAFLDALSREFDRAKRYRRMFTLLMIDIDHFKQINDTFGHSTGDMALKNLAAMMRATLRTTDVLGRLGGEEFAVLLPETTMDAARATAERLRALASLIEATSEKDHEIVRFTISIGVARASGDMQSPAMVLEIADEALYRAKRAGRNRVEVASDSLTRWA